MSRTRVKGMKLRPSIQCFAPKVPSVRLRPEYLWFPSHRHTGGHDPCDTVEIRNAIQVRKDASDERLWPLDWKDRNDCGSYGTYSSSLLPRNRSPSQVGASVVDVSSVSPSRPRARMHDRSTGTTGPRLAVYHHASDTSANILVITCNIPRVGRARALLPPQYPA
jgi:hypothetical protein